jgi:hypothetical protein
MRRIIFVVLALVLSANLASAGPIAAAVARYQAPPAPTAQRGPNRMLWPGIGLLAGGGAIALIGFTRATGAEIHGDPFSPSLNISAKETHNTAMGYTGIGIAALGGFLLMKGEKDRTSIAVGPQRVQVSVRF